MQVKIRDELVSSVLRTIGMVVEDESALAVHAALVLFVVQELTGLDELDDLRSQLDNEVDRIIESMT